MVQPFNSLHRSHRVHHRRQQSRLYCPLQRTICTLATQMKVVLHEGIISFINRSRTGCFKPSKGKIIDRYVLKFAPTTFISGVDLSLDGRSCRRSSQKSFAGVSAARFLPATGATPAARSRPGRHSAFPDVERPLADPQAPADLAYLLP